MQLPLEITALLFIGTVLYGVGVLCLGMLAAISLYELVAQKKKAPRRAP